MSYSIERAAVVGAGIMGAGIAALLASVGIPVTLLDVVPPDASETTDRTARNRIAQMGLDRVVRARPASAFFNPRATRLVSVGNIEDDFGRIAEADWVVEAIVEQLDAKRQLYARLEAVRRPGAIVSSNTSGLPANMLLEGRGEDFQRHFLITHFFNPVRFMKLLELVAGPRSDPDLMRFMGTFCTARLGKGVVYAKDRPSFIGNRIGNYGFAAAVHRMLREGYRIEELDAIFGPPLGRPRSAIFRTADLAGIDTLLHVADDLYRHLPQDPQRDLFQLPSFIREMVSRGWLGDKAGQGFYQKTRGADGTSVILALDPATLAYRAQESVHFSSLDSVKTVADTGERVRAVLASDNRAGRLAWELTADTLLYAASVAPEIAYDIVNIDNAMRWGFNWDLGPFQTWDLLGVAALAQRMAAEGRVLPPLVRAVLEHGTGRFYTEDGRYWDFTTQRYQPLPEQQPRLAIAPLKKAGKIVKENRSCSLVDLGDGILGVEFHTKMNAIDDSLAAMLHAAAEEGAQNWRAIVIGNDAPNFSAGADVTQVLMAARMRQWQLIEKAIQSLQDAMMALKYSPVPVVSAPVGYALGGGCEVVMHTHKVRAAVETYIGLVEVGIGLIPAGGGCAEMLARWASLSRESGPFAAARHAFEIIAVATVATSAYDAQYYGFLRASDAITLDRERLLADAKADALALAAAKERGAWQPPTPPTFHLPGAGGRLVLEQQVETLRLQGKASEHDAVVAGKLAFVLTGGDSTPLDALTELDILALEREAFLSLCGMPKTQQRIEAFLKTGRPLRN